MSISSSERKVFPYARLKEYSTLAFFKTGASFVLVSLTGASMKHWLTPPKHALTGASISYLYLTLVIST
jgi:hypothetical protein